MEVGSFLLVLLLGALLAIIVIVLPLRPAIYVYFGVSFALLSLAAIPESLAVLTSVTRLIACGWLLVAIVKQKSGKRGVIIVGDDKREYQAITTRFLLVCISYLVLNAFYLLVHGRESIEFIEGILGSILAFVFAALLLGCRFSIATPLKWALASFLAVGLLMAILVPEIGIVQNRLAGSFENANTTATVGAALIATVLLRRSFSTIDGLLIVMAFASVFWTASRTSAVIAAFFAVALLMHQRGWGTKIMLLGGGIFGSILVAWIIMTDSSSAFIFRSTQSRHAWAWALDQLKESPFVGSGQVVGPNGREVAAEVGSSFLTMAVMGGAFGLIIMGFIICLIGTVAIQSGYKATIVFIGFLLHSVFESWLVAPGSPVMLIFFCVFLSAVQIEQAQKHRSSTDLGRQTPSPYSRNFGRWSRQEAGT